MSRPTQDISETCRRELLALDVQCVFGDLLESCPEAVWPTGINERVIMSRTTPMIGHAWCYRHRKQCATRNVALNMTGTPCTDYSMANQSRQGIAGKTFPVLLWWSETVRRHKVPIFIHENVLQQPYEIFNDLFMGEYDILSLEISPGMVGFSLVERRRRYLLGLRKDSAELIADPRVVLQRAVACLSSTVTSPRHALMASFQEIRAEALEVCAARGLAPPVSVILGNSLEGLDLTCCLTERERESLEHYTWAYFGRFGHLPDNDPDCFFDLTDNAANRLTWSCVSGKIPTLRTGSSKCWSPCRKRWLTVNELLAVMGFPTYEPLARSMGVQTMEFQTRSQAKALLGNAMHAGVAGVAVLVCLSCVRLKPT